MAERMNNLTGKEWLQSSFTIWRDVVKTPEERATKHPALFPQELAEKLIRIYTKDEGETILDPFLGIGSTLLAAASLGRRGVGIELNESFANLAENRIKGHITRLKAQGSKTFSPKIYVGDSREVTKRLKPASIDLAITSPPYWDILNQKRTSDGKEVRNYSDGDNDLGNIASYEEFLGEMKTVFEGVYRALKPNKRCISIVMDIRKKDRFFPLHEDQSRIMREIGFELEEYVIWDRQREYNNMKTLGYPWVFRFNKVHEYICIYWKR